MGSKYGQILNGRWLSVEEERQSGLAEIWIDGDIGETIYFKSLANRRIVDLVMVRATIEENVPRIRNQKAMMQAQANKLLADKLVAIKLQANKLLASQCLASQEVANKLLADKLRVNKLLASQEVANKLQADKLQVNKRLASQELANKLQVDRKSVV